ncbi:efflux RND transporter periplasmic adaptor subunit [Algoriphagus sp. Y33]|uniref:efflux RND transporter periplasmic adaptor subunit n=1 Tax=Algoriphagus sp. Y33 TaxID=2772483 RepID=UPI0017809C1C|nr:efflux RND transporter periplasmic adaptor subunit [Algoriphagus sp. Y33]
MNKVNYLALAGILVLASCSHKEKEQTAEKNNVINVQTEQPTSYTGLIQSGYSGVVEAQKTTALSFATMGTITEIFVEEGQNVRKGQLLAKVNASNAQNAYQVALASQQQAEDAYRRMKPMKENGTLPEIKWIEVETGLAQAKAAVAIAQKSISDCYLYAPASGVIGKKNVQAGMNVVPSVTVLELLNIQTVYVKIPVSENEISQFKKGENAQITITAIDKTVTGTIKEIGVSADILSHTYPVKIEVQNTTGDIKPGMICSVQTTAQDKRSGSLISNKALQNDVYGNQFIYVEQNGKAEKIAVKTIALIDNKVLVQGEVLQNANIIISGQQKLSNGTPIQIIK